MSTDNSTSNDAEGDGQNPAPPPQFPEKRTQWRRLWFGVRVLLRVNGVIALILLAGLGILSLRARYEEKSALSSPKAQEVSRILGISGLEKATTIQRVVHRERRVPGEHAGLSEFFEVETAPFPETALSQTKDEKIWGGQWQRLSELSPAWIDIASQIVEVAHTLKCGWFPSMDTIQAGSIMLKMRFVNLDHGKVTWGELLICDREKQRIYYAEVRAYPRE